jgi:hypothetical protein
LDGHFAGETEAVRVVDDSEKVSGGGERESGRRERTERTERRREWERGKAGKWDVA